MNNGLTIILSNNGYFIVDNGMSNSRSTETMGSGSLWESEQRKVIRNYRMVL